MYKTNENKLYYELEAQYKSNTDKIVVLLISLANEPLEKAHQVIQQIKFMISNANELLDLMEKEAEKQNLFERSGKILQIREYRSELKQINVEMGNLVEQEDICVIDQDGDDDQIENETKIIEWDQASTPFENKQQRHDTSRLCRKRMMTYSTIITIMTIIFVLIYFIF